MAGRAAYTDEDKASVYVVLTANNGNIKRTARETGYPENTVRRWKHSFASDGPPNTDLVVDEADQFMREAEIIRRLAMKELKLKLPVAKVGELNAVIGTLTDKLNVIKGLATQRTEHTLALPSPEDLRDALGQAVEFAIAAAGTRQEEIIEANVVGVRKALPSISGST